MLTVGHLPSSGGTLDHDIFRIEPSSGRRGLPGKNADGRGSAALCAVPLFNLSKTLLPVPISSVPTSSAPMRNRAVAAPGPTRGIPALSTTMVRTYLIKGESGGREETSGRTACLRET